MNDDQPPHNLDAERAVLAAVLNQRAIGYVSRHISADDFYRPVHGTVFTAAQQLAEDGIEVDPITVGRRLEKAGELTRIGGLPFLHDLMAFPFMAATHEHVREIAETAVRRRLYAAGQRVMALARSGDGELADVLNRARASVDAADAAHRDREGSSGIDLGDLLALRLEQYEEPPQTGVATGWPDLDAYLGGGTGLMPGRLYVVAARPGVGKSMIGTTVAVAAARFGVRSLLASLEMIDLEVADRIFASESQVHLDALQSHKLDDDQRDRLRHTLARLRRAPARIDASPHMTLAKLRSIGRDMLRQDPPLGLVVADYLQLMTPSDSSVSREQQVGAFSRGLKLMAKEYQVPVIALAQLNRDVERRADKKPILADLRESGSIEQDADVIMLLSPAPNGAQIDVHIAKNRSGPRDVTVNLAWAPQYARVSSMTRPWEHP